MEDIVRNIIDARANHDATDLHLLAEGHDVWFDAEPLMGPPFAGNANASLDFVENEECFVFVAKFAQPLQELWTEMVVAPFTLDRLDDDCGNVVLIVDECLLDVFNSAG